jgi:hypothetical protein
MSNIRFFPLGNAVSSSVALRAGSSTTSTNTPTTASVAGVALNFTGSIGDSYLIVTASQGLLPNLGLIVGS